jgi:hypothetical protein
MKFTNSDLGLTGNDPNRCAVRATLFEFDLFSCYRGPITLETAFCGAAGRRAPHRRS